MYQTTLQETSLGPFGAENLWVVVRRDLVVCFGLCMWLVGVSVLVRLDVSKALF